MIGLGYVGLPVAVAFARQGTPVIGYDKDQNRIRELRRGHDRTRELTPRSADELTTLPLNLTADPALLGQADFHIVTVPTPIAPDRRPDLSAVLSASQAVGRYLKPGDIVVYESTVYPGVTEDLCLPILEQASGLAAGRDFSVGYSPERINPGDATHRFETIVKVVSAQDQPALDLIAAVYGDVVTAGIFRASSIRTAEAAKAIENTQRDLNVALMNELALICQRLDLDTLDVLEAAGTKWNFLRFTPGLVGGHCIGIDPYYLTYCAEQAGHHPEVILAGRRINDSMGPFVAQQLLKRLRAAGRHGPLKIVVLGLTFKEDVPDLRNSRVVDIVRELQEFGAIVQVHDPLADPDEIQAELGLAPTALDAIEPAHGVVLAVPHHSYRSAGWPLLQRCLQNGSGLVADVRGCLDRHLCPSTVSLWRL
ncbi:MAG: nucleotide sugar dehydrogenase [Acidobacteriaceae bacterium]|nr:nucleotide sugar dehydrogenase [Acidobacteriaceae bacterium]